MSCLDSIVNNRILHLAMTESHPTAKEKATLKSFMRIVEASKLMADDVLPELSSALDFGSLIELVNHCDDACTSLQAVVAYCKLSLQNGQQTHQQHRSESPESWTSAFDDTTDDEADGDCGSRSGSRFRGLEIKNDFVQLTDAIRQLLDAKKKFAINHCRPCQASCSSKESWSNHVGTAAHLRRMSSKLHHNVVCSCKRCPFALIASRRVAIVYMQYHIEKCHNVRTETVAVDHCMRLIPISNSNNNPGHFEGKKFAGNRQFSPSRPRPTSSLSSSTSGLHNEEAWGGKVEPVSYKGTVLNDGFLKVTEHIIRHLDWSEEFSIFYCRPCEVAKFSSPNWAEHLESTQHRGKMSDKRFRNFSSTCQLCSFEFVASEVIASRYCGYHLETCHGTKDVRGNMVLVEISPGGKNGAEPPMARATGPPPKPAWPPQKPAWQSGSVSKELFGSKAETPQGNDRIEERTFRAAKPEKSPIKEMIRQNSTADEKPTLSETKVKTKAFDEPPKTVWPTGAANESVWGPKVLKPAKQQSWPKFKMLSSASDISSAKNSTRPKVEEIESWPLY